MVEWPKGGLPTQAIRRSCLHQLSPSELESLPAELSAITLAPAMPCSPLTLHIVHLSLHDAHLQTYMCRSLGRSLCSQTCTRGTWNVKPTRFLQGKECVTCYPLRRLGVSMVNSLVGGLCFICDQDHTGASLRPLS